MLDSLIIGLGAFGHWVLVRTNPVPS